MECGRENSTATDRSGNLLDNDSGCTMVSDVDKYGRTSLHWAAIGAANWAGIGTKPYLDLVHYLFTMGGANASLANATDHDGRTALDCLTVKLEERHGSSHRYRGRGGDVDEVKQFLQSFAPATPPKPLLARLWPARKKKVQRLPGLTASVK